MAIQDVKEIQHLTGTTFQIGLACGHWVSKHLPDPRRLPRRIECVKCAIQEKNAR